MSETSTSYTPASTSTTVARNETVSLVEEIKKYKTESLIEYLRKEEDLGLDDDDLLTDFAKECKDKKLKAFSSYLSLSEVLEYGLNSNIFVFFWNPSFEFGLKQNPRHLL
ncbi:hypothetical protein RhiirC2_770450 [Rhizophagus irregularis]|uniref:Uncharacterized protein n=1 Tax=Rhizophagus irregularis TaxID=588596 RepID=A0A2N1NWE3_9GLOM|nr:hypothetical protein RhiirC2_770450 [Rhizophagus irregularis]